MCEYGTGGGLQKSTNFRSTNSCIIIIAMLRDDRAAKGLPLSYTVWNGSRGVCTHAEFFPSPAARSLASALEPAIIPTRQSAPVR